LAGLDLHLPALFPKEGARKKGYFQNYLQTDLRFPDEVTVVSDYCEPGFARSRGESVEFDWITITNILPICR